MARQPRPDLPQVPPVPGATHFLERVQQELRRLMGYGGAEGMAVTFEDLDGAGMLDTTRVVRGGSGVPPGAIIPPATGGTTEPEPDLTPPPSVSGLTAAATFSNVLIEWTVAGYTQGQGNAKTRLYAAKRLPTDPLATFGDAVLVYEATHPLTIAAIPSTLNTRWHIWAKFVSVDGVESPSPAGGVNGVQVTAGKIGNVDLNPLIVEAANLAANAVTEVKIDANAITAGKIAANAIAVGTAAIQNGALVNAMIANATIDNAKIFSVSAAKIIAGSIAVGEYIQSTSYVAGSAGWRIHGDGTAEFSGVVVRGQVIATSGSIGGNAIDATGFQSSGYVAGVSGFRLNASGAAEFRNITARGDIQATAINIGSGTGARTEYRDTVIRVYDASNVLRIKLGDLS